MVVKTSDRRWQMLWAFVVAVWVAFGIARVSAGGGVPVGSAFIDWCQNEASSTAYIVWMCFLYV